MTTFIQNYSKVIVATCAAIFMISAALAAATVIPNTAEGCCGGGDGGGGDPGASCFPAGTKISLPGGGTKNIEDVQIGDIVEAYDFETGTYTASEVLELESPLREGYYTINDGLLRVTNEHPIYTQKANGIVGWASIEPEVSYKDTELRPIYQLELGDDVFTKNGWITVVSFDYVDEKTQTYNLKTVTGNHTFFADGVLVHNKGGNIIPPPEPRRPVCTLSGVPSEINKGESATLSWTSARATSATIDHGLGNVALNGSDSVSPQVTTTYTLTVVGNGGTRTCNTTIKVKEPVTPVYPTCTLNANPTHVNYGGSSTLTWSSTNADSATIDNGIGSVSVNGSRNVSSITSDRTYVLTVTNQYGSATCSAYIDTENEQDETPMCDIYSSPSSVRKGNPVTLNWTSSNTHSASLTDFGSVNLSGSRTVYPNHDRTYTLTVHGNGGTRTCSTYVDVYDTPVEHSQPWCTISVNPNSVQQGKTAVLQWNSNNAVSATISQLGGYISLSGSRVVYGNTTTNYFMTVRNAYGETATCTTTLGVYSTPYNPPPVYYPPTPQPPVVYRVPVSYIPYTGPKDTAYALAMIAVLLGSLSGAAVLYSRLRRRSY